MSVFYSLGWHLEVIKMAFLFETAGTSSCLWWCLASQTHRSLLTELGRTGTSHLTLRVALSASAAVTLTQNSGAVYAVYYFPYHTL